MNHLTNEKGFTLIEAMVAAVILTTGVITYLVMQSTAIKGNKTGASITGKTSWATEQVEMILAKPYTELITMDKDGDGTNQDPMRKGVDKDDNGDSIIDANENFGLHHADTSTADGSKISPDGTYSIFWNVALSHPVENMVTVNVIVTSKKQNATQKAVELKYVKAKRY